MSLTYADWRAMIAQAPVARPERLIGNGGLVVLSPHPDDETLGASGLIAGAHAAGRKVALVALTDGDGSHRGSRTHPPARLAALREREQAAAMDVLAPGTEILRLRLPDGASMHHADFGGAAESVAALCTRIGATALATTPPRDNHPDHDAAWALAAQVEQMLPGLRLLAFPIWSVRTEPEADATAERAAFIPFRLETPAQKSAALACHATQLGGVVTDDPSGFTLPDWFLSHHSAPHEPVFWSRKRAPLPGPAHFRKLYGDDGDPWHVRSAPYERDKRAHVAGSLGDAWYNSLLEMGCGEGHFTAMLAERCDRALGVDVDPGIIDRAAAWHAGQSNLSFALAHLPDQFPEGTFDLFVLSEVLYFLDENGIAALIRRMEQSAIKGATAVLVNWLGDTSAPLSGEMAADLFIAMVGEKWELTMTERRPGYRVDRLLLRPAPF
ncbi:bifunctional PIG-L family deacetylase/class I SAM-dependent methyltransferase [Acuticoccus sp. MNP-M23]|uniref:bifunctional PIG-L family deacetylase/class I SAM-dependent methyltransferase n=1 Tax=Acuticoccus sp. MNP-M23 TaxID=3072793 RepID=UPI00281661B3|nr:bifunctional PIG-L family deacetylase/class I SAM-dependent methyltransferase [Acuticoccus sp. MNP-M23]WMS44543.1 bifunctional PIG-L family deacetylase/class I SAM-dependent methyltransferase [Acuticoccus sp. MNP-M23]